MSGTATSGRRAKPLEVHNSDISKQKGKDDRRKEIMPTMENVELEPPAYLTAGAKKVWLEILAKYEKYGVKILNDLDCYALENFCILVDIQRSIYRRWKTKEKKALTKEELKESTTYDEEDVKKSTTKVRSGVFNPSIVEMEKLAGQIERLAATLGLTPVGRASYAVRTEKRKNPVEEMQSEFGDVDFNDLN